MDPPHLTSLTVSKENNMQNANEILTNLLQDEWEARLLADPLFATLVGDHRYDDRLPDASEAGNQLWLGKLRGFRTRLNQIVPAELSQQEGLNHAIFGRLIDNEIHELEFHAYRMPVSKTGGFHSYLPEELPYVTPFDSVEDYHCYLTRLEAIPRYFDNQIEVMQMGLTTGFVPSRSTLEGLDTQVEKQIPAEPASHLFYMPFLNFPESIPGTERERLSTAGLSAVSQSVLPAYQKLLRFLKQEYIPAGTDQAGAWNLPDGRAFYQHRILHFTSLNLTAEQVHQTGLDEVARIQDEMGVVIKTVAFKGNLKSFGSFLRSDPRFYVDTPEALLKETALILKRMDGELPRLFKTLPRTPYGIRQVPEASAPASTTAYYFPPSGDGRTAGFYYVNTYDLKSRPIYELEALSLHEAVPGHHLQIALQQELELPNFRRFNGFIAFVEGWALYCERLGLEVGFYQDPYSNFGRLSYEMWRACRLVVDTGIHALGWSREQAINFMAEHTSLSLLNITNEVDRYIAWPGQALAYKIGELKIRELRRRAEQALGPLFNLREFHDVILTSGAVPLDILEGMVEAWINSIL